ncbi:hypothetical protein F4803DRAFT_517417, partial [Xylaria telfairii]
MVFKALGRNVRIGGLPLYTLIHGISVLACAAMSSKAVELIADAIKYTNMTFTPSSVPSDNMRNDLPVADVNFAHALMTLNQARLRRGIPPYN